MGTEKILSGPITIYSGAVAATAPDVDETPSTSIWTLLGEEFYDEDGVSVSFSETIEMEMILKSTMGQKAFRTAEEKSLTVNIKDMTVETLSRIMNNNAITDTAAASGVPGTKAMNLQRGLTVTELGLLLRGFSPYDTGGNNWGMQFWVPRCYVSELGEFTFTKTATILPGTFMILEHATSGAGTYTAQTAAAL